MKENIVEIKGLSHRYSTDWAIQDINLEIKKTGIMGLLGSNGAGKSTTMNILCGVISQTKGEVVIGGIDLKKEPEAAKKKIGFLPQSAPLFMELTVDEYLYHCAVLRQLAKKDIPQAMSEVKDRCGIAHFGKRLIRNLSGGYRQRVGIAQAIIHRPMLVVLDEPTNGLDPNQITEVRRLIREIAEERSVIFSSHILSEVQALCREVRMIENGRMVFEGQMDDFNNYVVPDSLLLTLAAPPLAEYLLAITGIREVEQVSANTVRLKFEDNITSEEIIRISFERGWRPKELTLEKSSLEDIFAQLSDHKKNKSI